MSKWVIKNKWSGEYMCEDDYWSHEQKNAIRFYDLEAAKDVADEHENAKVFHLKPKTPSWTIKNTDGEYLSSVEYYGIEECNVYWDENSQWGIPFANQDDADDALVGLHYLSDDFDDCEVVRV